MPDRAQPTYAGYHELIDYLTDRSQRLDVPPEEGARCYRWAERLVEDLSGIDPMSPFRPSVHPSDPPRHVTLPDGTRWPDPRVDEDDLSDIARRHHTRETMNAYWQLMLHPSGTEEAVRQLRALRRVLKVAPKDATPSPAPATLSGDAPKAG